MFNGFQPWHMLILLIVVIVLFGSKRLPDAARGLGRSLRILKSEVKQMNDDDKGAKELPAAAPESTDSAVKAPTADPTESQSKPA